MTSPTQSLKNKLASGDRERLSGLLKTAQAELLHLQQTDQRLFGTPFDPECLVVQLADIDFSGEWMHLLPDLVDCKTCWATSCYPLG